MQKTAPGKQTSRSKRLLIRLVVLLAVLVLAIVGNTLLSPLPSGAYPVLSTAEWADRVSLTTHYPHYTWLANGDLAYLERDTHGLFEVCYQQMNDKGSIGEVRHGPELPTGVPSGHFLGTFCPSPLS
jgi:hypothetical protein